MKQGSLPEVHLPIPLKVITRRLANDTEQGSGGLTGMLCFKPGVSFDVPCSHKAKTGSEAVMKPVIHCIEEVS